MVIIVGNGIGSSSSNPGYGCLHFTSHLHLLERHESISFLSSYGKTIDQTAFFSFRQATSLGEGKH